MLTLCKVQKQRFHLKQVESLEHNLHIKVAMILHYHPAARELHQH